MNTAKRTLVMAVFVGGLMVVAQPAHGAGAFVQWQDTEDGGSAFGLGLKHSFSVVPLFAIEARASWLRFDDLGPESINLFPLEAFGRVSFGLFYGGAGLGYYLFTGDIKPENSVGGFVAGGAQFTLGGLGAFAELRYLVLEPEGVKLSGFGANAGVVLPL